MLDHIADPSCYVEMGFVLSSALPQQLVINPLLAPVLFPPCCVCAFTKLNHCVKAVDSRRLKTR